VQQFSLFNNLEKTSADFVQNVDSIFLYIKLNPNAKNNSILSVITKNSQDYLKIQVNAKPINNQANNMLIKFLAEILNMPKSNLIIKSGLLSGYKVIRIEKNAKNTFEVVKNIIQTLIDKNNDN
jgi:uncharacterized protein (TIGR00251 family)